MRSLTRGATSGSVEQRRAWTQTLTPRSEANNTRPIQDETRRASGATWRHDNFAHARKLIRDAWKARAGLTSLPRNWMPPLSAPGPTGSDKYNWTSPPLLPQQANVGETSEPLKHSPSAGPSKTCQTRATFWSTPNSCSCGPRIGEQASTVTSGSRQCSHHVLCRSVTRAFI